MTNPTSNFGWQMPTSTDLVTDLPADFEVFGQAVDTSLADLKGGTSGQVLSKNSNTDMDFVWVTSDDANAIQNTIVDAKGDLIAASANDTPARLAVGNNGETLVADSSTSTGLRYQEPKAVNPILNSSFQIWQRGTSVATSGSSVKNYTADQWNLYRGALAGGATVSRQVTGDTTNLPNIQYCARVARDSGNTGTERIGFESSLETLNSIPFVGKTVTFSFYARKGANFSAASSILPFYVVQGTGTDQNCANTGFTSQSNAVSGNATLTTTWQRFTATGTILATSTEIGFSFLHTPSGTAGAADYYEVTGIQLEIGSVATPYKSNGGTIQGETSACMRYYQRLNSVTAYGGNGIIARTTSTGAGGVAAWVNTSIPMRVAPTALDSGGAWQLYGSNATPLSSITLNSDNPSTLSFIATASGATINQIYAVIANNNATSYLGWSAEL